MDIEEVIIVEGKYDKIKLDSLINATVIQTDGFKIFKDKNKKELIKRYALSRGIIILTDSDSAGMMIRNHLKSFIPQEYIKNAYVPCIHGKEKRKKTGGKEGILGVEGLDAETVLNALYSVSKGSFQENKRLITRSDLIADGISGGKNSKQKKEFLLKELGLPLTLNANSLTHALNSFSDYDSYKKIIDKFGK